MQARYYVPGVGRFASADTIVPDPANPQQFNRYAYSINNPIKYIDPSGHWECELHDHCEGYMPPPPPPILWLPIDKPDGLNEYGEAAWEGLTAIQEMESGWWGSRLDAQEALMLVLNHELGTELRQDGPSAPKDVLINQFNAYCSGGVWSSKCLNNFWGYSQVIREGRVSLDGGPRFRNAEHKEWVREIANNLLKHASEAQNQALFHYGNAFDDRTAYLLLMDYENGITTYTSYVSVSSYKRDPNLNLLVVDSVFVIQTYEQWRRTGTLQYWIYPYE